MASESKGEERAFDTIVIQNFLKDKDEVQGWIQEIDNATRTVQHLLDESKQAFDPEKDLEISRNLRKCTTTASGFAKKAKVSLDRMKAESQKMVKQYGPDDRTYQVHKMHYDRLIRAYVESIKAHQLAKQSISDASKSTLKRRAKVFFPGQTDEELDRRIADNPTGFAQEALLSEGANEQVQQVYSEVKSRARDVEMLAASIREVHEMFQEFATLLAHQHEQIDNIEVTVEQAATRVAKGNKELRGAIEYQKKLRKKYCCLAIVGVVILIIIFGSVGAKFR